MELSNNMEIWKEEMTSNPNYVKKATRGLSSVSAQSQKERATARWGPFGSDWGITNEQTEFITFVHPKSKATISQCFYQAVFYYHTYKDGGEKTKHTFPTASSWDLHDLDWALKMKTKAITKALSELGFNADLFMGYFDDVNYVAELQITQQEEDAHKQATKARIKTETSAALALLRAQVKLIEDINEKKKASELVAKKKEEGVFSVSKYDKDTIASLFETVEDVLKIQETNKQETNKQESNKQEKDEDQDGE